MRPADPACVPVGEARLFRRVRRSTSAAEQPLGASVAGIELSPAAFDAEPVHHFTAGQVDDGETATRLGLPRQERFVQGEPAERALAGQAQADDRCLADKGQAAGIAGDKGDRIEPGAVRVHNAEFTRPAVEWPDACRCGYSFRRARWAAA